jgi:hypothetical protein
MRFYTVPGILLIVAIVDFAIAAPVLVQEKPQAYADIADIPKYPVNVLGRQMDDIEEVGGGYIKTWFEKPEESSAARPSSSSPLLGSVDGGVGVKQLQPSYPEGPPPVSGPAPKVSDHKLTGVPVYEPLPIDTSGYTVVEEPPSRSASPFVSEADHGYQVVHPPPSPPPPLSGSASLTEPDYEVVDVPPSSSKSLTKPGRRSMGEDSRLENLQAVSDTLEGNAKESRGISGTGARDVLNAAQRELQRVRSLDPGE